MDPEDEKRINLTTSFGKFCKRRERGLKVLPSLPHSLSRSSSPSSLILRPSLFLFFSLLFACSFVIRLADELHGSQRDLYMMISSFFLVFYFVSWYFSHSVILFFSVFLPSFFVFRRSSRDANVMSLPHYRCHPRGGLTLLDLAPVVHEATKVFQPCCIITDWVGSPWPSSNPSPNKRKKEKKN